MHKILFRGKRIDNDEWAEGLLIVIPTDRDKKDSQYYIITEIDFRDTVYDVWKYAYEVYPETVGQFTNMTDENDKRLFDGDIVRCDDGVYVCHWDAGNCEFGIFNEHRSLGLAYVFPYIEIIGNVHDNPELLGVEYGFL
jgi:hypothetical protein